MRQPNNHMKRAAKAVIGMIGFAAMAGAAPMSFSPTTAQEDSPQATRAEKKPVAPDNSKKNKRDRDAKTLTPFDQGGSKEDIKLTQEIRKKIIHTKGVSTNGKNVKIISKDGVVTLRGPVASSEEKQIINDIAGKIAGSAKVQNELEVK